LHTDPTLNSQQAGTGHARSSYQGTCGSYHCIYDKGDDRNSGGVLFYNSNISVQDIADGTSNTFMVGERSWDGNASPVRGRGGLWVGRPENSTRFVNLVKTANDESYIIFGLDADAARSMHVGGAHFLMGDGAVRFVSMNIDGATYQNLGVTDDGNVIGEF
jgi:hypothetical protein